MSLMPGLLIFAGVVFVLAVFMVATYNALVSLQARYKNAFSQIEVQLKRRYDLIPNLVETARAYMRHEKETLENVISARNGALDSLKAAAENPGAPGVMKALGLSEQKLGGLLGGLRVQLEAYPELKASANMMQLSEELSSTENKVAFARQAYNDAATSYNIRRRSFPANLVAGMFGHGADAELLSFADSTAIQQAPKVQF